MRLVRIEAKDFAQHAELDLDLGSLPADQAVIVGKNGTGKSTLLDAVVWSLFGRATDRSESMDALIRRDQPSMWVRTTWRRGSETIVIRRDRSIETKAGESMLGLTVDGVSHKQHTIGETQAKIDALIGLDREQLLTGPFMEQNEADKLMRYDPGPRKALFASLCDLDRFVPWHERAKDWRDAAAIRIGGLDALIPAIQARLDREFAAQRDLRTAVDQVAAATAEMQQVAARQEVLVAEAQTLRDQAVRAETLSDRLALLNLEDERLVADVASADQAIARLTEEAAVKIPVLDLVDVPPVEQPGPDLAALQETAGKIPAAEREIASLEAQIEHARLVLAKAEAEGLCDRCPHRGQALDEAEHAAIVARIGKGQEWLVAHRDDAAKAAELRQRIAGSEAAYLQATRINHARQGAYDAAVRGQARADADLAEQKRQSTAWRERRSVIAEETAILQAERLRLIQTQDRAREVDEELRTLVARHDVANRLWAAGESTKKIAEATLADCTAAHVEMGVAVDERAAAIAERDTLEIVTRMYHRDGLPTMLLELTIPLVEARANELLGRMPGDLSIELVTQKATKSGRMTDTLDVAVTEAGRPLAYGMASGAERFRIDLALRLGLANVLLHRTGSQFETLWLDEPFRDQDAEALEGLLQSLTAVIGEFGLTLVVTHQVAVAERFPVRIEVRAAEHDTAAVSVAA